MRSLVAIPLVALALAAAACGGGAPTFAALRQSTVEEVPGTWGLVLRPPPTDLAPKVTPARARAIAFAQRPPGQVLETLALVPGSFVGTRHESPAWVVFARDLCYAQSKGDLVSSSRRDPNDVRRCSDRNLWVTMIDPASGQRLSSVGAYDTTGRWTPARGSA
jgi:hypothetical protein